MTLASPFLRLLVLAWLVLGVVVSCGGDPIAGAAADYHGRMLPVLLRNQELAQEFVNMATRVRTNELTVEETVEIWQGRIIPLADGLKNDAAAIVTGEPTLDAHHQQLLTAWIARSEAYRSMLKAFRDHDKEAFANARKNNVDAKMAEEAFFNSINNTLRPHGYWLDQFPG